MASSTTSAIESSTRAVKPTNEANKIVKEMEDMSLKRNEDIEALRKQLKLPQREHLQTKEIIQEQSEKYDMMNLILQLTAQVKEMEI